MKNPKVAGSAAVRPSNVTYPPSLAVHVYHHKTHHESLQKAIQAEAAETLKRALEKLVECEPDTSDRFFKMVVKAVLTDGLNGRRIPGGLDIDPVQSQSGVVDWLEAHGARPVGWYENPGNPYPWGKKWFWTGGFRSGRFPFLLSYAKTLPTMMELQEVLRGRHQVR